MLAIKTAHEILDFMQQRLHSAPAEVWDEALKLTRLGVKNEVQNESEERAELKRKLALEQAAKDSKIYKVA